MLRRLACLTMQPLCWGCGCLALAALASRQVTAGLPMVTSGCLTSPSLPMAESQTSRWLGSYTKLTFFFFCNFSQSCSPLPQGGGILSFSSKGCFITQGLMCSISQQTGSSTEDTQKVTTINSKHHLWRGQRHLVQKRLIRDKNEDLISMGGEEICSQ